MFDVYSCVYWLHLWLASVAHSEERKAFIFNFYRLLCFPSSMPIEVIRCASSRNSRSIYSPISWEIEEPCWGTFIAPHVGCVVNFLQTFLMLCFLIVLIKKNSWHFDSFGSISSEYEYAPSRPYCHFFIIIDYYQYTGNMYSLFSRNSGGNVSGSLENHK